MKTKFSCPYQICIEIRYTSLKFIFFCLCLFYFEVANKDLFWTKLKNEQPERFICFQADPSDFFKSACI
jgi:hypothetical protein